MHHDSNGPGFSRQNVSQPSDLVAQLCQYADVLAPYTGLNPTTSSGGATSEFEAVLGEFLEVAFQASLCSNEGRRVRCRLLLSRSLSDASVLFPQRREFTAENLAKFAPITGLGGTRIIVLSEDHRLSIIGFGNPQRGQEQSVLDPMHSHLADVVGATLSILDPGHLRIGIGSYIVELEKGQIREVESLSNVPQVEAWLAEAATALSPDHNVALPVIGRTWASLIANVSDQRHGGMFVVLPHSRTDADKCLHIRYPLQSAFFQEAIQRRIDIEPKLHSDSEVVSGSSLEILQEAPFIVRDLAHATELIAGFAGVDGAVVLARDLQIVGFGAEITAPGEFNETILEFQTDERRSQVSLENVGMRHRSAAYLARGAPGVLIFVVSQDGGASVFTMGASRIERHLVASTARMD